MSMHDTHWWQLKTYELNDVCKIAQLEAPQGPSTPFVRALLLVPPNCDEIAMGRQAAAAVNDANGGQIGSVRSNSEPPILHPHNL